MTDAAQVYTPPTTNDQPSAPAIFAPAAPAAPQDIPVDVSPLTSAVPMTSPTDTPTPQVSPVTTTEPVQPVSYVDSYVPMTPPTTSPAPAAAPVASVDELPPMNVQNTQPWQPAPEVSAFVTPVASEPVSPAPTPAVEPATSSPAPEPLLPEEKTLPMPPDEMLLSPAPTSTASAMPAAEPVTSTVPTSATSQTPPVLSDSSQSETLEDQNIFHLLGIEAAKEEEKESFLDELQEVIWQDFLESDLELLITAEEMVDFKKIQTETNISEDDRQAKMIEFLERIIPDLEKIMLEKALELKEEMARERIKEMTKDAAQNPDMAAKVQEAQSLMDNGQWRSAANLLNSIRA